jgi:hypothetical protein
MCVTLNYQSSIDTTASVGLVGPYNYGFNDCYDPDITGVGSQPLGFDQWSAIYARYMVIASKIEAMVTSRSVSNRFSACVVPSPSTGSNPTLYGPASEMRYAKICTTTGGGPSPVLRSDLSTSAVIGCPQFAVESDDGFSGTSSTSPAKRMVWTVIGETSGSSDAVSLMIRIKYKVRFWGPVLQGASLAETKLAERVARQTPAAAAAVVPAPSPPSPQVVVDRDHLERLRVLLADLRAPSLVERDWDGVPLPRP